MLTPTQARREAADAFVANVPNHPSVAAAARAMRSSFGAADPFTSDDQARLALSRSMERANITSPEEAEDSAGDNQTGWKEDPDKGTAAFNFKGKLDEPMTVDELLEACGVDVERWKVTGIECKAWGVTSKLKEYVMTTDKEGKPRSVPSNQYLQAGKNYGLTVKLAERTVDAADAIQESVDNLITRLSQIPKEARYMPPADFLAAGENKENRLLEPCIFDLHLEKLAWGPETGHADWGTKIAASGCLEAAEDLLTHYKNFGRILLPLGNDFFHCDNRTQNTSGGDHHLDADVRWTQAWDVGCDVAINLVKLCLEFAPVDVLIVPGNHDHQRSIHMGRVLHECFNHVEHVNVDYSPGFAKRFRWGRNLLGFCHGAPREIAYHKLGVEMMTRWPEDLPGTIHREWHLGDQHRMKSQGMTIEGYEEQSLRVRVIPSMCSPDFWHASNLYHNIRAAEVYLWDKEETYVGHHSYNIALKNKDRAGV